MLGNRNDILGYQFFLDEFFVISNMGFWKNSGYECRDIVDIPLEELILLVNAMTRQDIIEWLNWNDPNGIYTDERSLKEIGKVMTRKEGVEILLRHVEENRAVVTK